MDITKPLNELNEEAFDDKRLVQLFNRFATYNGSNPYVTSGIMSMIQHLEHDLGVYMPTNGLSDISKSIYNLANDLGVTFSFNSSIDKIITHKNKVTVLMLYIIAGPTYILTLLTSSLILLIRSPVRLFL